MIILFGQKETDTRLKVSVIHYSPEKLTEEEKTDGILVENIPNKPNDIFGKSLTLFINPVTKEMWYEYEDRPLTDSEKIEQLQSVVDQLVLDALT